MWHSSASSTTMVAVRGSYSCLDFIRIALLRELEKAFDISLYVFKIVLLALVNKCAIFQRAYERVVSFVFGVGYKARIYAIKI